MSIIKLFPQVALFLLLFTASIANAQQVSGQVRYADTGQAAFNVNVHCDGANTSQIQQTDRSGKFTCLLGSPGSFSVRVEAGGYLTEEQSGSALDSHSSEYMFFRLRPDPRGKTATTPANATDPNVPAEALKAFDKGVEAINAGTKEKIEAGAQQLEKAVSLYPKFLEAQVKLGAACMDLQQWDKAELAFKKALEIDPKAANAFLALGEIYLRQKKDEEAEKVLLQGLAIEDQSAQGHLILARVYVDMAAKIKDEVQNRPLRVKAYEQVNASLKYNADDSLAHWIKGNLLLSVGRNQDGQHEFEEYLRLSPKGPFADKSKTLIERIKKVESEKKP
jgi:predicted negative regulator of RcsB-dependent stress response